MAGTQSNGIGSHELQREEASGTRDETGSPVLSGISEAELEAIVSQLRTDKNPVVPTPPPTRKPLGAVTERLLLSASRIADPLADAAPPGAPLKGAEALRVLMDDAPRPLAPEPQPSEPPFLEPEPETEPAASAAPELTPVTAQAQGAAGVHPALSTGSPTHVEVRIHGGLWLALGGGLIGGFLMACLMWLVLPAATRSTDGAPSAPTGTAMVPAAVAPGTGVTAPASASANPAPLAGAPTPGATAPALPTGVGPGLGGTAASPVKSASAPTPLATRTPARSESADAPPRAVAPSRQVSPSPPPRKPAKAEALPQPKAPAEHRPAPPAKGVEEEEEDLGPDEDFARELAGPGRPAAPAPRTVWIPPAPPSTGTLTQSDIFSVVLANKADIVACANAHKPRGGERAVVRWTILPSGEVTDIATESAEFRGTPLARCLEGRISAWIFPRHREQGGPVRFPFVF